MKEPIGWKRKLSSRKFWVAIIGFITAILTISQFDPVTIEHIVGILGALSVLVIYIFSEGKVDESRNNNGHP